MEQSDSFNSLNVPFGESGSKEERSGGEVRQRRGRGKEEEDGQRENKSRESAVHLFKLTVLGLKGGGISSLSRRSQSIQRKNGCSLISLSASIPPPRRLAGFFVRSLVGERKSGENAILLSWDARGSRTQLLIFLSN